jgi:hypothetical protein
MGNGHFEPQLIRQGARARGCFNCSFFQGRLKGRVLNRDDGRAPRVVCKRGGGTQIVGIPMQGCADWQREPGSDDE